jgi:hypothetical protein
MSRSTTPTQLHGAPRPRRRGWFRRVEDEMQHLHELEVEGDSPATPAISIIRVMLVIVPVFALMVGLAVLAYYVIA